MKYNYQTPSFSFRFQERKPQRQARSQKYGTVKSLVGLSLQGFMCLERRVKASGSRMVAGASGIQAPEIRR